MPKVKEITCKRKFMIRNQFVTEIKGDFENPFLEELNPPPAGVEIVRLGSGNETGLIRVEENIPEEADPPSVLSLVQVKVVGKHYLS